ncbi:MAG: hypothetical protein DCC68_09785 [Planctomycetota bacterium]|nr:MAG: hypothetical protein DCC68_09785 [Planctomycetota bacterium]
MERSARCRDAACDRIKLADVRPARNHFIVVVRPAPLGLTYSDSIRGNASTAGGAATGAHPLTSESVVKAVGV